MGLATAAIAATVCDPVAAENYKTGADHRRYSCHSALMREGRWSHVATMLRYCRVPPAEAAASTELMLKSVIPFGIDTYEAPRAARKRAAQES